MSVSDRMDVFESIQAICRDFRKRLKRGEHQRIENYLGSIDESSREMLFQNLLHIDIEYRRRHEEDPTSEEYISRFPDYARLVREAFFESTMMSKDLARDTAEDDPTVVIGMPPARRLGDYELRRELGRGGFGVVYEARHLQRDDLVALKTLPCGIDGQSQSPGDADRLHKFRREFRSLCEVNHPNLVGMQTLEVDAGQWFFTMDLVDAVDFLSYVRPGGVVNEKRLRASLIQLVSGIMALHDRGIVHSDLKPSNVLVDSNGHVVILDFGLMAELQQASEQTLSMQSKHFVGTPRYAAPEQSDGLRSSAVDWYALGAMLYEVFTGTTPHKATGVFELMVKKKTHDAPKLAGNPAYPKDLAKLADQLLHREPEHRPDADAIAKTLGIELETVSHDSGDFSTTGLSTQGETTFLIGRETQLADLEEARKELIETRQPVAVFLSGRSGEGKTSLAEKFLTSVRRDGEMLVLTGRCYDRESVPFKAIDGLIDSLVAYLRSRTKYEVHELLPDDITMLAQLFPVLRRVEAIAELATLTVSGVDNRQIRYRAFAALRELLAAISRSMPVVLFVDDLQWGDADSAGALHELLLPPMAPTVMLLGSYRSDEAGESSFLNEWQQRVRESRLIIKQVIVELSNLTESQCISWFVAKLGGDIVTLRQKAIDLYQAAQGNPYFLEQLIEGFDPETRSFPAVSLTQIIDGRLSRLPAEARDLLKAIAVSGQALAVDEVSQVAGHDGPTLATLTHMRSEKLVRLIGSGSGQLVDTYHDRIRETVLQGMDPVERKDLHLKFGEFIELSTREEKQRRDESDAANPRVYDLAYHFFEAGDRRAFQYQLEAGRAALAEYATETALDNLQKAEQIQPAKLDARTKYQLQFSLAEAIRGTKRFEESRKLYESAIEFAETKLDVAQCEYGIGYGWAKQGEMAVAKKHFDVTLASLGAPVPQTKIGKITGTIANLMMFHLVPSWLRLSRHSRDLQDSQALLLSTTYNLYAYVAWTDLWDWLNAFSRITVVGKFSRDLGAKAIAYSSYGGLLAHSGFAWLGRHYAKKGQLFAEGCESELSKALHAHNTGVYLYASGKLEEAQWQLKASVPELQRVQHYNLALSYHWLRHVHSIIGDAESIVKWASHELSCAEQTQDNVSIAYAHYGLADGLSRRGECNQALAHAHESVDRLVKSGVLATGIGYQELGRAQLLSSDYRSAAETLRRAAEFIRANWLFIELFVDTYSLQTEAILGPDWCDGPGAIDKNKLREAKSTAAMARRFCRRLPTLRPHGFRARGRAAFAAGKSAKAVRFFDKAIAAAEQVGARYEYARGLIDRSMIVREESNSKREQGLQILDELGCILPEAERKKLQRSP